MTVNGIRQPYEGKSIEEVIHLMALRKERIVSELNGCIIGKACYETTVLKQGDVLEIVTFVGGG